MLPRPGVKRFLLVTLGITGLYLALNALWLALTPSLAALFDARTESAWARDAAAVADAARDADGRLPVATRVAAYRLGFQVGYCSNVLGSVALSPPEVQSRVREILAPRIKAMQDLGRTGRRRGFPPARVERRGIRPRERSAGFGRARIGGAGREGHVPAPPASAAARHARRCRRRAHRHQRRQLQNPLRQYIGRHATLAGVPPAGWEPAARVGRRHARTTSGRVSGRAHRVRRGCGRAARRWSLTSAVRRGWDRTTGDCRLETIRFTLHTREAV